MYFIICFRLKDKYGIKCSHWKGEGRDGKKFVRDTPTGGIRDAKERGEDENMIGDATEKSVRIGGGG